MRAEKCPGCNGKQFVPIRVKQRCTICIGSGNSNIPADNGSCFGCKGSGIQEIISGYINCRGCGGVGWIYYP